MDSMFSLNIINISERQTIFFSQDLVLNRQGLVQNKIDIQIHETKVARTDMRPLNRKVLGEFITFFIHGSFRKGDSISEFVATSTQMISW